MGFNLTPALILLVAFLTRDTTIAVMAAGLLLLASTDYVDRQRRLLRRSLNIAGAALLVAGLYAQSAGYPAGIQNWLK